jgi:hypothetical protein
MPVNRAHKEAEQALLAQIPELPNWSCRRIERIASDKNFQAAMVKIFTKSSKTSRVFKRLHSHVNARLQAHQQAGSAAKEPNQVIVDDNAMVHEAMEDDEDQAEEDQPMEHQAADDENEAQPMEHGAIEDEAHQGDEDQQMEHEAIEDEAHQGDEDQQMEHEAIEAPGNRVHGEEPVQEEAAHAQGNRVEGQRWITRQTKDAPAQTAAGENRKLARIEEEPARMVKIKSEGNIPALVESSRDDSQEDLRGLSTSGTISYHDVLHCIPGDSISGNKEFNYERG